MRKYRHYIIGGTVALLGGLGAWFFLTIGEFEKPQVHLSPNLTTIGRQTAFTATFSDTGRGLDNVSITLVQDNTKHVLAESRYDRRDVHQDSLSVTIDPLSLRLREGAATLTVTATDRSLWKNKTVLT
ncbi:MAG: hypothetical protein N2Z74_02955, partial [Syntrophales bacterium]|nr:hypothetical protein [Syntrophales bacterium]